MKTLRILAIILLLFNGTGALFGGWSLIQDPTGSDLKLPLSLLKHSPFNDYFVPGIILFVANGVYSLVTMAWTAFQWRHYSWLILIQGVLLTGWILVQMILLREISYLQFIYGGIGLALLWIGYSLRGKHQ
jgi:hypothetical protein